MFPTRLASLVLGLVLAPALLAGERSPPIRAWFGPRPLGSPDGLDTRFIEFVASARKTLDGAFYEIRLDSLVDAFVEAHRRGVTVRLVVDDANFHGKNGSGSPNRRTRNPFVKRLLDAGIEVEQDAGRSALMHNKFAVADGKRIWSGSYNLTDTCTTRNHNNGIRIESPDLAAVFTRQFEEMFVAGEFGPRRTSTVADQTVTVGSSRVEVWFAPEDDPMSRQMEIIANAREAVYFMQFAFTADEMAALLVKKASQDGVVVKGLMDHRLYRSTGPYSTFSRLTAAGIPVVIHQSGEGKFHHKVFIVDPGTDHACVISGSENTSNNGNTANDENVLIIHDRKLASQFARTFETLYGETSRTQADLVYAEVPVAGEVLSSAELYLYANGRPVADVVVEFPARWPVSDEVIRRISVTVAGEPLPAGSAAIEGKRAVFTGVNLAAAGKRSLMSVHFDELDIPDIAGSYSPLVSVRPQAGGDLVPLARQPTIKVYAPDSREMMAEIFDHLRLMFHKLGRMKDLPGDGADRHQVAWARDFERLRRTVIASAVHGHFDAVETAVEFLEQLDAPELAAFRKLTGNARDFRRALAAHRDDDRARSLMDRLAQIGVGR